MKACGCPVLSRHIVTCTHYVLSPKAPLNIARLMARMTWGMVKGGGGQGWSHFSKGCRNVIGQAISLWAAQVDLLSITVVHQLRQQGCHVGLSCHLSHGHTASARLLNIAFSVVWKCHETASSMTPSTACRGTALSLTKSHARQRHERIQHCKGHDSQGS